MTTSFVTRAALGLCLTVLASCQAAEVQPPSPGPVRDCPVIESRDWSAWIDAMPSVPPRGSVLHVVGEVVLPTPGYQATLTAGAADRSARPIQQLILTLTPPTGMVAQVLTPVAVRYDGPAISMQYGGLRIMCGGTLLTQLDNVLVAR